MILKTALTIALALAILYANLTSAMAIGEPKSSASNDLALSSIALNTTSLKEATDPAAMAQITITIPIDTPHTHSKRDFGTCINIFEKGNHNGKAIHNVCSRPNACMSLDPNAGFDVIGSIAFKGSTWCIVYQDTKCTSKWDDYMRLVVESSAGVYDWDLPYEPTKSLRCARPN